MGKAEQKVSLALAKGIVDLGAVKQIKESHSKDCAYPQEFCNCDPELTINTSSGSMIILDTGLLKAVS